MKIKKILVVGHSIASPFVPAIILNLQKLGYDVSFFDQFRPDIIAKSIGVVKNLSKKSKLTIQPFDKLLNTYINLALTQTTNKIRPDLVFFFKCKNINPETVTLLKKTAIVINWYPDYFDDWAWIKDNAAAFDYFFTPCEYVQEKLKEINIHAEYIPFAAQADTKFTRSIQKYNASFVGRFTKRRDILFRDVFKAGLLDIWGYHHWQNSQFKSRYHGQISPNECIEIIRKSKITINTLTATDDVLVKSVNYRVFEATGVGGFVLTSYHYPFEKFFKLGKEIEVFHSPQEAAEKVKFYLKNDSAREKIAKAGWERTRKDHTYQKRLKSLISFIK